MSKSTKTPEQEEETKGEATAAPEEDPKPAEETPKDNPSEEKPAEEKPEEKGDSEETPTEETPENAEKRGNIGRAACALLLIGFNFAPGGHGEQGCPVHTLVKDELLYAYHFSVNVPGGGMCPGGHTGFHVCVRDGEKHALGSIKLPLRPVPGRTAIHPYIGKVLLPPRLRLITAV